MLLIGGVNYEKNSIGNNRAHCISRYWCSKCYSNYDIESRLRDNPLAYYNFDALY